MTFPEFIGAFGETGLFAALALFIIWFLVKAQERNEERLEKANKQVEDIAKSFADTLAERDRRFTEAMDRRDERFSSALSALTERFTGELHRHREEMTALRVSLAARLGEEPSRR
jgi:hypothetical protein